MDKSAQAEPAAFDSALSQYLVETLVRERRRRLYKTSRVLAFLLAALLACQIPFSRSNAADTLGAYNSPSLTGVAAFACPPLRYLTPSRAAVRTASLDRLKFTASN
jgi:hypothetical protein